MDAFSFGMHINFQTETKPTVNENSVNTRNIRMSKAYGMDERTEKASSGVLMDIGEGKNASHGFKGLSGKSNGREEKNDLLDGVDSFDAKNAHNYMAVMSNTMSDRDFQAMKEEGFHPGRMSEGEAVTGLDRIKVVLAKSGVSVAGFTDTLDRATVAEITGSVSEANAIMNDTPVDAKLLENESALKDFVAAGLKNADLPATEENIKDAVNAFNTAANIEPMDQGSMEFMLSNEEEPTIENVYMAEHSGSGSGSGGASGYFNNEGTGYMSEIAETEDLQALSGQIDTIIENAGLEVNEETRKDAEYLIKSGFALNSETLNLYKDLKEISFPLKAGDLMAEIGETIARGESAGNAYLIKGYNRIKNERILNETRLQMNIEANRTIDSDNGFVLETGELSDKVDELRAKERAFFRTAFMKEGGETAFSLEESIDLAEETIYKVSAIKEMPAALSGTFASAEDFTVNDVYEAGKDLKERFDAANMTYEAVGTEVRPDLGDRIGNAFRNAGELLHELGIKETEENLRAVRILGYNSMEITGENIADVKAADQTVRTLISRLTGSAAVSLIREGVNPLETGVQELIEKISDMQGLDGENAKFSEYLFKLERNNEITEDEATSYIGIFRLLRQIENSDGAVIGSLVNSGKELSLRNLLTELRTRGKGHIDFSIDKDFGGVTAAEDASLNLKIDTQIETAFRNEEDGGSRREQQYAENLLKELNDSISPERLPEIEKLDGDSTLEDILDMVRRNSTKPDNGLEEQFITEEAEVIREAAEKEDRVYEMLLRYGQEITAENVNAMDFLMNERGAFFNELMNVLGENYRNNLKSRSDKILEKMGESNEEDSGEDTADAVREAYGEMAEETEELIKDASENAGKYIDLKALQNLNRRLTVAKALSNEENYEIPMEIGGRLTSVNVKFIRGTGESKAAVSFETEETGQVYGEFTYTAGRISGYVTASSDNGEKILKDMSAGFFESLDNAKITRNSIIFEKTLSQDINRIPETADKDSIKSVQMPASGKDRAENISGKDAETTPAVLYKTVKIFLNNVR